MEKAKKTLSISKGLKPIWLKVKWFDAVKGYGFLKDEKYPSDIFLHYSMLAPCDFVVPDKDDQYLCEVAFEKGELAVKKILQHKPFNPFKTKRRITDINPVDPKDVKPARFMQLDDNAVITEELGHIKWYNPLKGFGFARLDKGGQDVFIHGSLVESQGLRDKLVPGKRLKLKVTLSQRGPEARDIELTND